MWWKLTQNIHINLHCAFADSHWKENVYGGLTNATNVFKHWNSLWFYASEIIWNWTKQRLVDEKKARKREKTMSRRRQAREFKWNRVFNGATVMMMVRFHFIWLPPNWFYRLKRCVFMWLFIYLYLRECVYVCLLLFVCTFPWSPSKDSEWTQQSTYDSCHSANTYTENVYLPK